MASTWKSKMKASWKELTALALYGSAMTASYLAVKAAYYWPVVASACDIQFTSF